MLLTVHSCEEEAELEPWFKLLASSCDEPVWNSSFVEYSFLKRVRQGATSQVYEAGTFVLHSSGSVLRDP